MPTDKDYLCNGMQEKSEGLQQGEKLDTIVNVDKSLIKPAC